MIPKDGKSVKRRLTVTQSNDEEAGSTPVGSSLRDDLFVSGYCGTLPTVALSVILAEARRQPGRYLL